MNIEVFNLMSRTRHVKWYETFKCKCRLDASVCNSKQNWKNDKCRFECKELIEKDICDMGIFGIQVTVNVNGINYVMLDNI